MRHIDTRYNALVCLYTIEKKKFIICISFPHCLEENVSVLIQIQFKLVFHDSPINYK